jgi:hypothetical protein
MATKHKRKPPPKVVVKRRKTPKEKPVAAAPVDNSQVAQPTPPMPFGMSAQSFPQNH